MAATQVKRALLSVHNKGGLLEFARGLDGLGVQLISSGGTAAALRAGNLPVLEVSEVTGFPELFGGRVKTLHPKIHGGILARRDDPADLRTLEQYGIPPIDLVCVSLYPFEATVGKAGCTLEEAVENIDVGGPSMIRGAAKNWKSVYVLTRPQQYAPVLRSLRERGCWLDATLSEELAREAFASTARYDIAIHRWMSGRNGQPWPRRLFLEFRLGEVLRYGENPHQQGAVYWDAGRTTMPASGNVAGGAGHSGSQASGIHAAASGSGSGSGTGIAPVTGSRADGDSMTGDDSGRSLASKWKAAFASLVRARLLSGKELSYNNLHDADAAWRIVNEFEEPAACVIKHANPCGAAVDETGSAAVERAWNGDPAAAFGGIIGCNFPVDLAAAEAMTKPGRFVEVIVAPSFHPEAVRRIVEGPAWGRSVRLLAAKDEADGSSASRVINVENSGTYDRYAGGSAILQSLSASTTGSGVFNSLDSRNPAMTVPAQTAQATATAVGSSSGKIRLAPTAPALPLDYKRIGGGLLVQTADAEPDDPARWRVVTARPPTPRETADLRFAWTMVRHVKSNGVLLVKDRCLVGVGAGQMKRSDSSSVACRIAGDRARGAVAASDAFFPFRDGLDEVARAGVTAVIQPGGSKRDDEVVSAADQQSLAMVFTGRRHFKH